MTDTLPAYTPASGASDAPTTPTSAAGQTPTGPNAAGLNPAPSTVSANSLDPAIANKPLPGASNVGVTAATKSTPLDEKQLVQELATHLGVKATKAKPLEVAVVDALASKYDVHVPESDMTTSGTGTGQGTVGGIRHNIASWFNQASSGLNSAVVDPVGEKLTGSKPQAEVDQVAAQDAAMKIKSPKLRALALKKLAAQQNDLGTSPGTPEPVPNSKALNDMLAEVGKKLGVGATDLGQTGLANIAKAEALPTATTATPASAGSTQTAGDAYQTFIKELSDTKTGAKFAAAQVPALEAAGLLDKNAAGTKQTNGTTYTNDQIATAYQQVLNQQVTNNQSEAAALSALASNTNTAAGPTSEMQAYVQGVAQEFGVGLTAQQITEISNTYGANATTADDPSSVEDEIKDAVVALYDPTNPANPSGVADTMFTDIQQSALQYQIPITAQQIGQMVKTSLQGATVESMYVAADAAEAAATKQFQEQAQGLYPALSAQIAAGNTVQNLVAPYFNVAEAYTGVPASTMMADQQTGGPSKWSAFLQGGTNPAGATQNAPGTTDTTGGPQMMTLDQWKTELMQNPTYGFQNTQGAKDMAEQMTSAILNEFGKVNTMGGTSEPFNAYSPSSALSANTS